MRRPLRFRALRATSIPPTALHPAVPTASWRNNLIPARRSRRSRLQMQMLAVLSARWAPAARPTACHFRVGNGLSQRYVRSMNRTRCRASLIDLSTVTLDHRPATSQCCSISLVAATAELPNPSIEPFPKIWCCCELGSIERR
jgi:hypothetical protein